MTFAITEDCISSHSCISECPVDCMIATDGRVVIDPVRCIDCGACLNVCPVDAIVKDEDATATDLKYNKTESARLRKK